MSATITAKLVEPCLIFGGTCEKAIEFYRKTVGAEVESLKRFKDCPEASSPEMLPPGTENKILHASLHIGESVVMVSDGMCDMAEGFQGISLSLTAEDADEAQRVFAALSEGGEASMPLAKTFWSPLFGMLKDRYGVSWMITVPYK